MYGAILGDIIGQPYEFGPYNIKTKDYDKRRSFRYVHGYLQLSKY